MVKLHRNIAKKKGMIYLLLCELLAGMILTTASLHYLYFGTRWIVVRLCIDISSILEDLILIICQTFFIQFINVALDVVWQLQR